MVGPRGERGHLIVISHVSLRLALNDDVRAAKLFKTQSIRSRPVGCLRGGDSSKVWRRERSTQPISAPAANGLFSG